MKKYILYVLLALPSIVLAQTPTQTKNYIMTKTYQKGYVKGQEQNATNEEKIATVQYIDGLGRPIQNVDVRAGGNSEDIITFINYDILGRQAKEYLPYTATSTGGTFRTNAVNSTNSFYNTTKYGNTSNPYSEKHFETSPLNRIVEQSAPGGTWLLNKSSDTDHTIKFGYKSNTSNDVKKYTVTLSYASNTYTPTLQGGSSYYGANELYKTITKDENWKVSDGNNRTTQEFKNKRGQVILKRTYADISGASTAHDTYYVYDDYGNLSYVLPPKSEPQSAKPDATELSELCYQYKYDDRNRLIEKKIPGKDWEFIVYNKLDQPILTQDAILDSQNKWLFTKYDALGRVAFTGVSNTSASRWALQNSANNFTVNIVSKSSSANWLGGVNVYYNNEGYPTTISEVQTINYYDNYIFDLNGGVNPGTVYGVTTVSTVKGLATGSKVKVLGTSDWITTVTYYDDKSRPIYVYTKNDYLNTTDILESKLDDFTGIVLETKTTHKKIGKTDIVKIDRFEYDHTGRVLTQTQDINNAVSRRLVKNNYDELGQLESKLVDNGTQDGYKDMVGVTVTNGVALKTASDTWGNGGFATNGSISSDGYVELEVLMTSTYSMFGLSNANSNAHFNTIKYAIYLDWGTGFRIYESGSNKGSFGTYQIGDIFRIERVGTNIHYIKNGENIYTSSVSSSGNLLGDVAIRNTGRKVKIHLVDNTKGLQTIDYKYNVRGWLKEINDINNLGDDLFSFRINYDTPSAGTALYNGNISQVRWKTKNTDQSLKSYTFGYDALNRITYATNSVANYSMWAVLYDKNGNLTRLFRKGHTNLSATTFGNMDQLFYTYQTKSNKLTKVLDNGADNYGFKDGANQTTEYTYDANGNMKTDANKGITNIDYNHLNLPTQVTINGQNISYIYDAVGAKLRKIVNGTNTDYAGNYVYENNNLQFFNHAEGYVTPDQSSFKYVYQYKDHLGNVRLSYNDADGSGTIAQSEIIEENNYYPFGLKHKGYNTNVGAGGNSVAQRYKFGGKELQDEIVGGGSLEWYDITARNYDPALGRWMNLDPLAEDMTRHSPYNYAFDNPVFFVDPDGMMPCPTGDCPPDLNGNRAYQRDNRQVAVSNGGSPNSRSSGSIASSSVSGTDVVRSVSAELAYTGIKTARDRVAHNKKVHTQKMTSAQRDALRVKGQAKEPAITKAFREKARPASNESNRPKNNVNKSNAGVNKKASIMGKAGGVFLIAGLEASATNIANADNKSEAVATEAGGWGGAMLGGEMAGAATFSSVSRNPWVVLGATVGGSIVGGFLGQGAVQQAINFMDLGDSKIRKRTPHKRLE